MLWSPVGTVLNACIYIYLFKSKYCGPFPATTCQNSLSLCKLYLVVALLLLMCKIVERRGLYELRFVEFLDFLLKFNLVIEYYKQMPMNYEIWLKYKLYPCSSYFKFIYHKGIASQSPKNTPTSLWSGCFLNELNISLAVQCREKKAPKFRYLESIIVIWKDGPAVSSRHYVIHIGTLSKWV